jgi:hypothetical protein
VALNTPFEGYAAGAGPNGACNLNGLASIWTLSILVNAKPLNSNTFTAAIRVLAFDGIYSHKQIPAQANRSKFVSKYLHL